MPPKRLAEEKKEWTKKAIQKATQKVFFEKGYANATVEETAHLAGVAKGSIYLHFQTNDYLYLSLMILVLEEVKKSLMEFQGKVVSGQTQTGSEIVTGFFNRNSFKTYSAINRNFLNFNFSFLFPRMKA